MNLRRLAFVSVLAFSAVALTACAPHPSPTRAPSPSASTSHSASPTPTPTPTPTPLVAAKIQFTHDGLTVVSTTNAVMGQVPFTDDPAHATAVLGAFIGTTAPIQNHPAGQCTGTYSTAEWGSALTLDWNTDPGDRGPEQFYATSRAANIGSIVVGTPTGFKVGDSAAAYLAGTPGAVSMFGGYEIYYGLDADQVGVMASVDSGKVVLISSPVNVAHDC